MSDADVTGAPAVLAVVADDHLLFRELLTGLLEREDWLDVVAQGRSGTEAIELARLHQPGIAVLDVQMPGPGIEETVRQIRRHSPGTRCVVLTMHDTPELLGRLLETGVAAYLLKSISPQELLMAVRSVVREPDRVTLAVSRNMARMLTAGRQPPLLTPRETVILGRVAQAQSNMRIADELFLAEATVKRHLTNIYRKLGAVSRVDAIRRARDSGIL
ncbi:response regulator transcription factor [Streptomyces niveiscabiei]|uniref:response regulator transcription factor n=1 Tax=Streptomyces niveiscabiei TaxID=164115 RepID=UPI0029BD77C4|nr:response regulator transcription factor [Streptomyces niveiscabiei]MDX3384065.1 response regulator transcription factor [Streptomyces niveiscabiei]